MDKKTSHPFRADVHSLAELYDSLAREHGDNAHAAQQRDRATQEQRMRMLAQVGDIRHAKILDFGCATGHLLTFLRGEFGFAGEYVGYDLSEEMVKIAREKFPEARFERRDVLADGIDEQFDFVFVSGTFNNRLADNWSLVTTLLQPLFACTRQALAFNGLSTYVDYFDEGLYYFEPEKIFGFCKTQLSPLVTLRHDYCIKPGVVPYEFTIYVHKTDIAPRGSKTP